MRAPLYNHHEIPFNKPENAHAGLWFERFFNRYDDNNWEKIDDSAKSAWIKTVTGAKVGDRQQLETFAERQIALVDALKGVSQRYTSDWNFISGMGNSHPVENGFSWHPTLGVPFLTGASVKGLVRAWVELNAEDLEPEALKNRLKRWFGTEKKGDVAEQTGDFIFFDALPDEPSQLTCDIMTPHMGKWYSEGDTASATDSKVIPADWHEPIPVPFLATKKTSLIFHIAPRKSGDSVELEKVIQALTDALDYLGAGAKTSAGYGYFSQDEKFEKDRKEELEKAERDKKEAEENKLLSDQQLAIKALVKSFKVTKENKRKEIIGGDLYRDLKSLISLAIAENWNEQDRKLLQGHAKEMIVYMGAKPNKGKPRDLINSLN